MGHPPGPPPSYIPQPQHAQGYHHGPGGGVGGIYHDPHGIRFCLHRYVYIWPRYGRPFWAYPTQVGWNNLSGYRWRGRTGQWEPFSYNLNQIANYQCM
ncbi:transporter [Tumebacillus permanentifrigoris]|nr:transporter [Tumebacillus permanentifrigoris]